MGEAQAGNQLDLCQNGKKLGHLLFLLMRLMSLPKAPSPSSGIIWRGGTGTRLLRNRLEVDIVGESFMYIQNKGWFPAHTSSPPQGQASPSSPPQFPSSQKGTKNKGMS